MLAQEGKSERFPAPKSRYGMLRKSAKVNIIIVLYSFVVSDKN